MLWMPILQLERKGNVKNIANPIKKGKTKWQVVHKIIQKELDKYEGTSEGSQKTELKISIEAEKHTLLFHNAHFV